jgi:hypothetical protein
VTGEVSSEVIGEGEEIGVLDRARHRILLRPLAQDDGFIGEDDVDGRWQVGLSLFVTGELLMLEDDDRGKPVRQLLLRRHPLPGKGSAISDEQRDQAKSERRHKSGAGSRKSEGGETAGHVTRASHH